MLDTGCGDINMFIQGIRCLENGMMFLCSPDNYEDMNILSKENIQELITSCAGLADELVVDLSCVYDARTKELFEIADKVLIVTAPEYSAKIKLEQFKSQNNVYQSIKDKVTFVANKNAAIDETIAEAAISLPLVSAGRMGDVYKALAMNSFLARVES